jgi:aminoglycoside 3-N-acetyltransferase
LAAGSTITRPPLDPYLVVDAESRARADRLIKSCFDTLHLPRDGVVLVHSAFRSLADAGHSPHAVIDSMAAATAGGTLLMPTMSWRTVNAANPVFDELATPSSTGVLTELFRLRHATARSLHPTHSVAGAGVAARGLLGGAPRDTPCHDGGPWALLAEAGAHVLLLGVGMASCTLIHRAEEIVAPDLYVEPVAAAERHVCRSRGGAEILVATRRHRRLRRNFHIFRDRLEALGGVRRYRDGKIEGQSFRADAMLMTAVEMLLARPDLILTTPTDDAA